MSAPIDKNTEELTSYARFLSKRLATLEAAAEQSAEATAKLSKAAAIQAEVNRQLIEQLEYAHSRISSLEQEIESNG